MKLFVTLCLLFIAQFSLISSTSAANSTAIIVTLPPLSGLTQMLLPEIPAQCLLSASADPHHFQPSPKQVDMLSQGNLLIRASADDQGWPIQTQQAHTLDLWLTQNHGWLMFSEVQQALPTLASALASKFPQYAARIQSRLVQKLQDINVLEKSWENLLQHIKNKGVFMQHPAWLGLFNQYQVPVWAVLESAKHGHEHGPRHLEEALQNLDTHPDALLIGSTRHSNRSLEWLNRHHKPTAPIIHLDELGTCNQPWDVLMADNLKLLSQRR